MELYSHTDRVPTPVFPLNPVESTETSKKCLLNEWIKRSHRDVWRTKCDNAFIIPNHDQRLILIELPLSLLFHVLYLCRLVSALRVRNVLLGLDSPGYRLTLGEEKENGGPQFLMCWELVIKNPPAEVGDRWRRFDPWVRKIPWRRGWQPIQYSCLENPRGQRSLEGYSL